jgi:ABC-type dipeptide/oligopeptide/nickel transport system permease component
VITAVIIVAAVIAVIANTVVDIAHMGLDPRIRHVPDA